MVLLATCTCGRSLSLKNELAGERIRCPDCGGTIDVPAIAPQSDPAFDHDTFLLRQRVLSIAQAYDVRGAGGNCTCATAGSASCSRCGRRGNWRSDS